MIDVLWLRFDAPLMSFGGPMIDRNGVTADAPTLSMLTGLIANSLGYDHGDADRLGRLQERIHYAARRDRDGQLLTDYQTVDLGQEHLRHPGWTTRGRVEERGKGKATRETHIRLRDYWADAVYSVALTLDPQDESPNIERIEGALRHPTRPLFIGRKSCLPAAPLVIGRARCADLLEGLRRLPAHPRCADSTTTLEAWWPGPRAVADGVFAEGSRLVPVVDTRDWRNQIHGGRRLLRHGRIHLEEGARDGDA